jgi:D-serine deaminase-like pyridoxal phosphate-dependent protein
LLSHAGHAYLAQSAAAIATIARDEAAILERIASELRASGVAVDEISVGSTPTARYIGDQRGISEMRPGNFVFFDRTQVGLEAATLDDCAMTVLSRVVSRPAPDRVIFDAGSKTLTSDGIRGFEPATGFGLVLPGLDARVPDPTIVIERLSEEHATARVPRESSLAVGDHVRILPNHACVVTNLADDLLVVEGTAIVATMAVAARGKNA